MYYIICLLSILNNYIYIFFCFLFTLFFILNIVNYCCDDTITILQGKIENHLHYTTNIYSIYCHCINNTFYTSSSSSLSSSSSSSSLSSSSFSSSSSSSSSFSSLSSSSSSFSSLSSSSSLS